MEMEITNACDARQLANKVYKEKENYYINLINKSITDACNEGKYECLIQFKEIVPEKLINTLRKKGYLVAYNKVCHYQYDGYEDDKTAIKVSW